MSYSRHYGTRTPAEIVELKRARARARYESSLITPQTGGAGVQNTATAGDIEGFTPGQNISPKEANLQGQAHDQGQDQATDVGLEQPQVEVQSQVPDAEPEEDQVNALDRIHDLVAAMSGFVELHSPEAKAAWAELERDFGPIVVSEVEIPNPIIGVDDPPEALKAVVIRKFPGNKWMVRPHKLSKSPEGMLFLRGSEWVKEGWTIWVRPNSFASLGGYQLHGEYNKYGDRLK